MIFNIKLFGQTIPIVLPAYALSIITIICVALFFLIWFQKTSKDIQPPPINAGNARKKKKEQKTSVLDLNTPAGKLVKADFLPMLLITLIYSVAALFYLGTTNTPVTYFRFESDTNYATIDLGAEYELDSVQYYTFGEHSSDEQGHYALLVSSDLQNWRAAFLMRQLYSKTFNWLWGERDINFTGTARYLRVVANKTPLELGELCLYTANADGEKLPIDPANYKVLDNPGASALFDEYETVPPDGVSPLNSAYFDEIYHARAAHEHLNGRYPYENTHPPLGKYIIAFGVYLFGMNPFGFRIMGTLLGIAMVPLIYILLKMMLNNTRFSAIGTILFTFNFMHFTQTRISTIDVYSVFFILLMYIFMMKYITSGYDTPLFKTLIPLALCGLSFGLGAVAKWTSIYAGIGLVALYVLYLVKRYLHFRNERKLHEYTPFLLGTLAFSVLFFIIVPVALYIVCYLPYAAARGYNMSLGGAWKAMIENVVSMYNYHSGLVSTHRYASRWYEWLLDMKPICYYYDNINGTVRDIAAFDHPMLSWAGLFCLFYCAKLAFSERQRDAILMIAGYIAQMIPWLLISRLSFAYHYFSTTIFLAGAVAIVFSHMEKQLPSYRKWINIFVAVYLGIFLMFYPLLSGFPVPEWYARPFLQWMPLWPL